MQFGVGFGIFFAGWLAVTIAAVVMVQKKRMHLKQKLWIIMGYLLSYSIKASIVSFFLSIYLSLSSSVYLSMSLSIAPTSLLAKSFTSWAKYFKFYQKNAY